MSIDKKYKYNPNSGVIKNIATGKVVGATHSKGYLTTGEHLNHRLAWRLHYGEWPNGHIDHINQIKTDNRIENLRCVTNAENHKNMPLQSNNKSGLPGVHWARAKNRWVSYIKLNNKRLHLGSFVDFFEACCCRKSAESKLDFHANHGKPL